MQAIPTHLTDKLLADAKQREAAAKVTSRTVSAAEREAAAAAVLDNLNRGVARFLRGEG